MKNYLLNIKNLILKKKGIYPFLFLFVFGFTAFCQGQTRFNIRSNTQGWAIPTGLINYDTLYRVVGGGGEIVGRSQLRITDFDSKGNLIRTRFYGDSVQFVFTGRYSTIGMAKNGNIGIGGSITNSKTIGNSYFMLLDQNGDSIKFTEYVKPKLQFNSQVRALKNNKGFVVCGRTATVLNNMNVFLLTRYDNLGNVKWTKEYGTLTNDDEATAIAVCSDGGFLLGGWTESYGVPNAKGRQNIWIVKTDSLGNKEWDKVFGDSLTDCVFSILESKFGGYYLAGCHTEPGENNSEKESYSSPYLLKIDKLGNSIWEKTYGTPEYSTGFLSMIELPNGDLVGAGIDGADKFGKYEANSGLVIKMDSAGNQIWKRSHNHPDAFPDSLSILPYSNIYDIKATKDGGFVAVGETQTSRGGQYIWLIKMDSMGCLVSGCDTIKEKKDTTSIAVFENERESQVKIYPNPANSEVNLQFSEGFQNQEVKILLYNMLGKIVFQKKVVVSGSPVILNTDEFKTGLYLIRIYGNNKNYYNGKLLIEH